MLCFFFGVKFRIEFNFFIFLIRGFEIFTFFCFNFCFNINLLIEVDRLYSLFLCFVGEDEYIVVLEFYFFEFFLNFVGSVLCVLKKLLFFFEIFIGFFFFILNLKKLIKCIFDIDIKKLNICI